MSIVCEHLSKSYGGQPVVQDVSLEVTDGEFFVLLGPSGSGKSTILRIIAGLADADSGRVLLHGRDVTALPPQKRGVGFVFQNYALFRHMTVGENIEFGLEVRRVGKAERRRKRDELLELVGLAGFGSRMPRELSGGQQQRVALARALAHRPEVLLLDEPFGALDAKIRIELRRTVRAIQRELGVAAIFVTHDQEEAFEIGDRVAILDHGRLLEVGDPEELYLRPDTEFVASFLGSANLFVGQTEPDGVRIGPVTLPLASQPAADGRLPKVQVLFRPEDVAVKDSPDALMWPALGKAVVEHTAFYGSYERLRLRLREITGVRSIAPRAEFGDEGLVVEASRSTHQARRYPLRPGDTAWVGVRRFHALHHPGLHFLVAVDGTDPARGAIDYAVAFARRAHARMTVLVTGDPGGPTAVSIESSRERLAQGLGGLDVRIVPGAIDEAIAEETARQAFDLFFVDRPAADRAERIAAMIAGCGTSVLVANAGAQPPRRALICVAGGEPGKADVLFSGRLLRHVGAHATVFMVRSGGDGAAERFADAGVRTLATFGVPGRPLVVDGSPPERIAAESGSSEYDLVVLGAPLPASDGSIRLSGIVGDLLESESSPPLLIVRGNP